ncbi:MAG TPA: hypothetical protein DHU96_12445 [Actinobacteria bacterium]|nr:hypothetical protein [Actinomycetota bacterium]
MCLAGDPDESYDCPPAACRRCGAGLAGEPVTASRRHQVTDIGPPPEPKVTQHVAQAKECPCCRTVTEGELPAHARGAGQLRAGGLRAGREPDLRPLHPGSPGHGAAVPARRDHGLHRVDGRGPGEGRRADRGQRVHGPGPRAPAGRPAIHADETPARAAGGTSSSRASRTGRPGWPAC